MPAECDVSIRSGWFWHASESPKSALHLLDIYYKSVGRNCLFLLNVPPNSSGLISSEDIQVLQEFNKIRKSIFSLNLAENALITATSTRGGVDSRFGSSNCIIEGMYTYWAPEENRSDWTLFLEFKGSVSFNVLRVQEPIQMGQRIMEFHLDTLNEDREWEKVTNGTTVGFQRLLQFPTVRSWKLRFVIDKSRADPLISYMGIYTDRFSTLNRLFNETSESHLNQSVIFQKDMYNDSQIARI